MLVSNSLKQLASKSGLALLYTPGFPLIDDNLEEIDSAFGQSHTKGSPRMHQVSCPQALNV